MSIQCLQQNKKSCSLTSEDLSMHNALDFKKVPPIDDLPVLGKSHLIEIILL